jgi:hypothetical protein
MTDDLQRGTPGENTYEIEHGVETHDIEVGADAPLDPDGTADASGEPNPWLKEGADAPDAADIEDPTEQR